MPRLDHKGMLVNETNSFVKDICSNNGVYHFAFGDHFPVTDLDLWQWNDQIHLSVNKGMPLLIQPIHAKKSNDNHKM